MLSHDSCRVLLFLLCPGCNICRKPPCHGSGWSPDEQYSIRAPSIRIDLVSYSFHRQLCCFTIATSSHEELKSRVTSYGYESWHMSSPSRRFIQVGKVRPHREWAAATNESGVREAERIPEFTHRPCVGEILQSLAASHIRLLGQSQCARGRRDCALSELPSRRMRSRRSCWAISASDARSPQRLQ